jgi:hypothetical protein
MTRVACTHPTETSGMTQGGGVLCPRVARTRSCFGGAEGRVDICRSGTCICRVVGNPQLGYNWFESSFAPR